VYGKTRNERYVDEQGTVRKRVRHLPREEWSVFLPRHHEGFIDWTTFETIQARLHSNIRAELHQAGRALREGSALLQGLVICGHCGRYQYRREISPEGDVHKRIHAVAMPDWRVRLKEHHEGYITREEFLKNQERLEKNLTNREERVLAGPAREGLALLQGLLLCGHCGRALTVRYLGNAAVSTPAINATGYAAKVWRARTA
jgi:hypothetical protein